MILVAGSTGLVGTEVCRLLAEQNKPVRALVRVDSDSQKVTHLQSMGATIAIGDLKDPASLAAACAGVTQVISTATCIISVREGDSIETVDRQGQLNLVEAAKQAGINRFVFISFAHNPDNTFPLSDAKQAVETALAHSGMNWSSLQASYFMEMWLSPVLGFNYPDRQARIYGDGTNPITWISFRDVAQLAVAALQNEYADNRACAIGGPKPLSPNEAIGIFEKATGTPFTVENVPVSALQGQKAGATNPFEATFAGLMLQYADGDTIDMTDILEQTGLRLSSVEEYATAVNA
ncbi:MAG: SDR family oxidoreductase [Rudanella sp.]|nr:SDR family oxidoreductase [Rudanella sp.]